MRCEGIQERGVIARQFMLKVMIIFAAVFSPCLVKAEDFGMLEVLASGPAGGIHAGHGERLGTGGGHAADALGEIAIKADGGADFSEAGGGGQGEAALDAVAHEGHGVIFVMAADNP